MKGIILFASCLIASAFGLVGFYANAQMAPKEPSAPEDDAELFRCVTDATIQVTADPPKIDLEGSSRLRWSVELPAGCSAVHIRLNGDAVARTGSRTVSPPRSTTFSVVVSLTRLGRHAETRKFARLEIDYPDRVVIDATTRDPVQVLIGALEQPNRIVDGKPIPIVVELCDVDLDLTGHSLTIGSDRSLIASAACTRGPRSFGPRIFVTSNRDLNGGLFVIRGDNILFSGFRLQGPTSDIGAGGDHLERGILIFPFESPDPIRNIEISNMEILHWSGAAIQVRDNTVLAERGRLFNTNEAAVRIKNNFLHHNRHGDGYGYGVVVGNGAYALIQQNVFDENRHAIAGGSSNGKKDFSGYTLRDNLILRGGGLHCSEHWIFAISGWRLNCWQTHQVDMHGNKDAFFLGESCCGTAGETIIIARNTILYDAGYAIKIRGNPADKAVADGNVFKHSSRFDAIAQNGDPGWGGLGGDNITKPIDVRANNVFGVDPLSALGSCDFVGDGQADRFMATGVTWWARSPVTLQWRYLNTMPERLPQLQFGDFDRDGKCDVAERSLRPELAPGKYSKSGTGPWVPLIAGVSPSP